jgi:hypothetical protein
MDTKPQRTDEKLPPEPPTLLQQMRSFVRDNIIPVNGTLGLSIALVGLLDFFSPMLGAIGMRLIAATAASFAIALFWLALRSEPNAERVGRAAVGILLVLFSVGTAAASTRADKGGWLAAGSERARAVQVALFDLEKQLQVVKAGVDQANTTLNTMAVPGSACQDFDCAFIEGASVEKFKELISRGTTMPDHGQLVRRMVTARWPHRFEIVGLYLAQGRDINAPLLVGLPIMRGFMPGMDIALKVSAQLQGQDLVQFADQVAVCPVRFRWLELAYFAGDRQLMDWLVARGADPARETPWCVNGGAAFSVKQWDIAALSR